MTQSQDILVWGHSLADYRQMFALEESDLEKTILDCGAGPASFNAEMAQQGHQVVSCDTLYGLSEAEIAKQVEATLAHLETEVAKNQQHFVWDSAQSAQAFNTMHRQATQQFLKDFPAGKQKKRYITETLPHLSFVDYTFDLALSSHYLFHQPAKDDDHAFHIAALLEMCRVANEARIFPLLNSKGEISELVGPLMLELQQQNLGVEIREVPYQFQKNGNAMLRVWSNTCEV